MLLSDTTIKKYLTEGLIKVLPEVKPDDVKSIGIRLHLGRDFLKPWPGKEINFKENSDSFFESLKVENSGYFLQPGEFILGTTAERFQVPRNIVAFLDGRSTLARLGLGVHVTSQFADGNYDNASSVTLEIKNSGPFKILLTPGMAICMLSFFELSEPVSSEARFLYKNQTTVTPPEMQA